jgi:hypothetical protein
LKAASFKAPTPQTEQWFEDSFNRTLDMYRGLLADVSQGQLQLADRDFDTGAMTSPAEYRLADAAYAKLAVKLADRGPGSIDPKLRDNVLDFYRNLDLPFDTKKHADEWSKTLAAIDKLKKTAAAL